MCGEVPAARPEAKYSGLAGRRDCPVQLFRKQSIRRSAAGALLAIWLCLATLLPIYMLFKAMFRPDLRRRIPTARILRG